jgi:hypothetical protein
MKRFLILFSFIWSFCISAHSQATGLADLKFGRYQIADSQWNVSACMYTTTCQIYSKNPGTAYKIPWTNGQLSWASGDYVAFAATGNATNPWNAVQYNSAGTQKAVMGTGHIINMGTDYFFFVGNDNNTGQLFSMTSGFANTSGLTWTGTLNPTVAQVNTYATNGSTTPLAAGQTAAPAGPVWTSVRPLITSVTPTSNNSPTAERAPNAVDGDVNTKYLNFDKANAGFTIKLSQGKVLAQIKFTTANDFEPRDPASYSLYGSNDGTTWTKIVDSQAISLPSARYSDSPTYSITNTNAYVYYYIQFNTTKDMSNCGLACDSVQIGEVTLYYDSNNTTTSTATGSTIVDPVTAGSLCCGGTSAPFNADTTNNSKITTFVNRTTADSQVHIEQIGTSNTIVVNQTGTKNNYTKIYNNGYSNDITVNQSGTANTAVNYVDLTIGNGASSSYNDVSITQQSTGGAKGAFVNISGNSNTLVLQQKDNGSHYSEVTLSGGNKNVDILQQGSASHMSRVTLTGLPVDLSLSQSGSTQQFYSINFNCATSGGCAKISVTQGQ